MQEKATKIFGTLHPFFESGDILGRIVANESFLQALVLCNYFDEYHFFLANGASVVALKQKVAQVFEEQQIQDAFKFFLRRDLPQQLQENEYFCFHFSDCITDQVWLAQLRNIYSKQIFPVTGITHSLSYANYPVHFLKHMWKGCSQRDAIVATSQGGHDVVTSYFRLLQKNYGLSFPSPQIPVIPLATTPVDCTDKEKEQARKTVRKLLNISDDCVLFLVFARLSHYSKMDPLPLLRAFIQAQDKGLAKQPHAIVMAGFAEQDDEVLATLKTMAEQAGITVCFQLSPSNAEKKQLYLAADVFCSMVDNVQETFGITVVEAAAYALPSIVSEYDGYKDIIVHGETGFLIPTIAAKFEEQYSILAMVEPDSHYHLTLAQQTAFDAGAMADALVRLGTSPALRETMGQAALERFARKFSWQVVIKQWLELWEQLWQAPVAEVALRQARHPLLLDFAQIFGHYPAIIVNDALLVQLTEHGKAVYQRKESPIIYEGIAEYVNVAVFRYMLFLVRKPATCAVIRTDISEKYPEYRHISFLLSWCLKHGIIHIVEPA